jgi:hypothetical protein
MAKVLNMSDVVHLLTQNLHEEEMAAKKVLSVGQVILKESASEPETEKKGPKSGKEEQSAMKSKEDEKKSATNLHRRSA